MSLCLGAPRLHLILKILDYIADRIQILRNKLLVGDFDAEGFLEEGDQFQDPGGVDDSVFEEGIRCFQAIAGFSEKKVVDDELTNLLIKCLGHVVSIDNLAGTFPEKGNIANIKMAEG